MEGHVVKALGWRLWRASRRKYIKIPFYILFPILLAVLLTQVKVHNSPGENIQNGTFPPALPSEYFFSQELLAGNRFDVLFYPDNNGTRLIMKKFNDLMPPKSINNIMGMESEVEIESWLSDHYKNKSVVFENSNVGFGVIFKELTNDSLTYALRSTQMTIWQTRNLFPAYMGPGPAEAGQHYITSGFISLQAAINMGYMDYLKVNFSQDWWFQEFPYPPYKLETKQAFEMVYIYGLHSVLITGFFPLVLFLVANIVTEKNNGSREILRLNGVNDLGIYGYWFAFFFWQSFIIVTVIVILFKINTGGGSLLEYSNPFLLWLFFMLFCIQMIFMVFAISSVFTNSAYATFFTIVFYLIMNGAISYFMKATTTFIGFLTVLTPMGSLFHGLKVITSLESSKVGLQFSQLGYKVPNTGEGPMFLIVFIMGISCAFFTHIFKYLDAIKPGEYGSAKPWHFFLPDFVKKFCQIAPDLQDEDLKKKNPSKVIEEANIPVGIKIDNVYKVFGALQAVNGLSIDIYQDQITVLLGHNGAGKTTLISILTGVISPTSGEVIVNGLNLFENMTNFRKDFGYCPQHDILLCDLSVHEQIIFFGMVRGLPRAQISREAVDLMSKFDIQHRKNALPAQLSGGMKRKLCLAISLANNPKVLFLDEPTSGLDPQSRRNIWDTLLALRGNRTMIISTHFMEEADVLGDKIAIMAHGEIRCYGSSIFLKKHFGSGHQVTITYNLDVNPANIKEVVQEVIPTVKTSEKIQQRQLVLNVPIEDTSKLPSLFKELENVQGSSIKGIGVNCTSMEEVFLKVQEGEGISTDFDETDFAYMGKNNLTKLHGIGLVVQQFFALLVKRGLLFKSSLIFSLILLILFPSYMTYITFGTMNTVTEDVQSMPLTMDLENYGETTVLVGGRDDPLTNSYKKCVQNQKSTTVVTDKETAKELYQAAEDDLPHFRNFMIVAADFLNSPIALYSSLAFHAPAIAISLLFNAFINVGNPKVPKTIRTINYPYSFDQDPCDPNQVVSFVIPYIWLFLASGIMVSMTYFVRFPISERVNGMKQLQYMSGLSPMTYWASNLTFDIGLFCIILVVFLITGYTMDVNHILHDGDVISLIVLILFLYALSMMCVCYFMSFLFTTYSGAKNVIVMISLIFSLMPLLTDWLTNDNKFAHYIFYVSPTTPFTQAIYKIMTVVKNRLMCKNCTLGLLGQVCQELNKNNGFDLTTCLVFLIVDIILFLVLTLLMDYRYIQLGIHLVKEKLYGPIEKGGDSVDADVSLEKHKVTSSTLGMRHRKKSAPMMHNDQLEHVDIDFIDAPNDGSTNSTDQIIERSNGELENSPKISSEDLVLITDSLGKKYNRDLTAVYDVSFTVAKGECFGLLGVNGAGKTTTFSILSGEIFASRGDAVMHVPNGYHTLSQTRSKFLQNIGYCPQENRISMELTAYQLLNLFALLRGAPKYDAQKLAEQWIRNLDLHLYCHKPCGKYSGGNKRKLCTAIALIADPPVILLDEPTTGVDPVTRRKLWKVFKQIQSNDQTIVLTSHSMDECEATCDRLTIMVGGAMRCIGTIQYLKQKFAQGFTIFIKIDVLTSDEEVEMIKNKVVTLFGHYCELKDEFKGFLHYHLSDLSYKWSQLFEKMESLKKDCDKIDEYMLSDTSLEQVFLTLSKEQKAQADN